MLLKVSAGLWACAPKCLPMSLSEFLVLLSQSLVWTYESFPSFQTVGQLTLHGRNWVAVNMIRNSCHATTLSASVSSSLGPIRMCRKHEQYLKVYLVCLLLLVLDGQAHSRVNHGRRRNPLRSSPTHSRRFPRAQPWCIFRIVHVSVLLSSQRESVSLPPSEVCLRRRSMHGLLLPILFSFWYPAFIK